jgi:parallel beta-helix repeat protein
MARSSTDVMVSLSLALACFAVGARPAIARQSDVATLGGPPLLYADVRRAVDEAALPPLGPPDRPTRVLAERTQVNQRAEARGLGLQSALETSDRAGAVVPRLAAADRLEKRRQRVEYTGTSLSGLAPLLQPDTEIVIKSARITVDRALDLRQRDVTITCEASELVQPPFAATAPAWRPTPLHQSGLIGAVKAAFLVEEADGFVLRGCAFDNVQAAIIGNTSGAQLLNLRIERSPGYGVIMAPGNRDVAVLTSEIVGGYGAGILVMTGNDEVVIKDNTISDGIGASNYHAGILVTDRRVYREIGTTDFLLNDWHFPPIDVIPNRSSPTNVFILSNTISGMLSSGIYLDGAYGTYVRGNYVAGNSKEGICLDNGTTGAVVYGNDIVANGRRWGSQDYVLERDFVLRFGRMEDGTATAKVPGISMDNAMYNVIMANNVSGNYGSGIKMVRTSFFNLVGNNIISDNNKGRNEVHFFFGIEVGGAASDISADAVMDHDFLPSGGNILFGNMIVGQHYAGIQFCDACQDNDVFDNIIIRPERWAIEQTKPGLKNYFTNNFSPARSRNGPLNGSNGRVLIGGDIVND